MYRTIISFILLAFLPFACELNRDPEPGVLEELELTSHSIELIESDNLFGLELFQTVLQNDDSKNVMISPLSVALALGMTYNGAEGTTEEAMRETLKLSGLTDDEINACYKSIIDQLVKLDPKVILNIANSIWYLLGYPVEAEFIKLNQDFYYAEVNEMDFSRSDAVDIINDWVNIKTNGLIPEVLDEIPGNVIMYLINAIYFKGTWKYEFKKSDTHEADFYLAPGESKKVSMMQMEQDLDYYSNETFSAVSLPYGDGEFSMMVMLPKEDKTTDDVVDLMNSENWQEWIEGFHETEVKVILPKFKYGFKKLLNDDLKDLGMGIAFSGDADFTGINPAGALYISRVIHQTFIEVNEEGTEAAAVTVVEMRELSAGGYQFTVDRPFIFVIRENSSGALLFMGKVSDPEY
jgi:serine protease inhibitor